MPIYVYRCSDCEEQFKVNHSMQEDWEACEVCNSENIARVPMFSSNLKLFKKKKKVGDVTKEFIENAKSDLQKQKTEIDNKR